MGRLIIIFILGSLVNPAYQAFEKRALDVNDVSFLFPKNKKNSLKPHPEVSFSHEPQNSKTLKQVLNFLKEQIGTRAFNQIVDGEYLDEPQNWYLTSARFEFCGHEFSRNPVHARFPIREDLCVFRLRLVYQPYQEFSGQILTSALHFVYQIPPSLINFVELLLFKLKEKSYQLSLNYNLSHTHQQTLKPHPILVHEVQQMTFSSSFKSSFGNALKENIIKIIEKSQLDIVTATIHNRINTWVFFGGLCKDQAWIPFSDRPIEELSCDTEDRCLSRLIGNLSLTKPYDLSSLFTVQNLPFQRSPDRETQVMVEKIESIKEADFFNTTCISCHVSTKFRNRKQILEPHLLSQLGPTPFVLPKYRNNLLSDVINFGYSRDTPKISLRTSSESVDSAHFLNKKYNLKLHSLIRKDQINQFWVCLNQLNKNQNEKNCYLQL